MKYMGSKARIAKHILPIMLKEAEALEITKWVEPFVGGGNMIERIPSYFEKIGSDSNPHTIAAMLAVRDFYNDLPDSVDETVYKNLKGTPSAPIESWIRFVCSVGGKFENGYARDKTNRNYAAEGKRNAMKQSSKIQDVEFICCEYKYLTNISDCLIYCDPPYEGTTGYKTETFSHEEFWDWCRKMANNNKIFISEYKAPSDFICVWQGNVKTNFSVGRKESTHVATEKLFTI